MHSACMASKPHRLWYFTGDMPFLSSNQLGSPHSRSYRPLQRRFFLLWPWTLSYGLSLRTWPRWCQVKVNQRTRYLSTVISFKNYCLDT